MYKKPLEAVLFPSAKNRYLKHVRDRGMSPETDRGYAIDLNQLQSHLSKVKNGPVYVDEITEEDMKSFHQSFVERGLKPASLRRKLNSTSSFFSFAVKKRWVLFNPTEDIERVPIKNQERTFLEADEIQKLIKAIDHDIVYYFVVMMVNTGLRVSECANLTLKDVDLQKGIVSVIEGKGGKNRNIPMNAYLISLMEHYKQNVRTAKGTLNFFATDKTGGVSPQYVNVILRKAAKQAGIEKKITSHTLRHSFASQLVKTDTHVAVIQRLLGHSDVRTTSLYMHANTSDLESAVGTLSFMSTVDEGDSNEEFIR